MSSVAKVVNRGDIFEEIGIQNKWKWEWLSKVVKVGETDERIGTHFCQILFQRCCIRQSRHQEKKEKKVFLFDDVEMHDCDA